MPLINYALVSRNSVILADALAFNDEHSDWSVSNVKGYTNIGMKSNATTSILKRIKLKFGKKSKADDDDDDNDTDGYNTTHNGSVYIQLAKQVLSILDTSRNLQFFCAQNIHEKYNVVATVHESLVYLCIADKEKGKALPFCFLRAIKKELLTSGTKLQEGRGCAPYALHFFAKVLLQKMDDICIMEMESLPIDRNLSVEKIHEIREDVDLFLSLVNDFWEDREIEARLYQEDYDKAEILKKSCDSFRLPAKNFCGRKSRWQRNKKFAILSSVVLIALASYWYIS